MDPQLHQRHLVNLPPQNPAEKQKKIDRQHTWLPVEFIGH